MSKSEDRLNEMFEKIQKAHRILCQLESNWTKTDDEKQRIERLQKEIKYHLEVISCVTGVFYAK